MGMADAAAPARPVRIPDRFRTVTTAVSLAAPLALGAAVLVVATTALPAIRHFGPGFLVARDWNPVTQSFGALPFVYGTVVTSFLALAMALPVGIGVAVFLAESPPSCSRS